MDVDLNKDGKLDEKEMALIQERFQAKKKMAWTATASMIVATGFLFLPIISPDKVKALSDALIFFYIAQAGIVAAFFGVSAWVDKK